MYNNLGIHWASTIPAILAAACVPSPFLFYRYGPAIRRKCKFLREGEAMMKMKGENIQQPEEEAAPSQESVSSSPDAEDGDKDIEKGLP